MARMISKFRLYLLGVLTLQSSYAHALTVSDKNASYLHGADSYMTEEVSYPTKEEIAARDIEMTFIVDRLKSLMSIYQKGLPGWEISRALS